MKPCPSTSVQSKEHDKWALNSIQACRVNLIEAEDCLCWHALLWVRQCEARKSVQNRCRAGNSSSPGEEASAGQQQTRGRRQYNNKPGGVAHA